MTKSIYATLIFLSGVGSLATEARATTIRTAGPNDPYLYPATYSYSNVVHGTSGGFYNTEIIDANAKKYPIGGSISGQRYITVDGGHTLLTDTANSKVSDEHLGTVSVSVQTTNDDADARAALFYSFTLVGPDAAYVPVTISAYGSTSLHPGTAGSAFANATMTINNLNPFTNAQDGFIQDVSNYEHHPFEATIDVKPNLDASHGASSIYLSVRANAGDTNGGEPGGCTDGVHLYYCFAGSASAYIDPIISIADPTLAPLYTIVVSLSSVPDSGVPVSPVPLPKSLPMFGAGLLALGTLSYAMNRRKRIAV